MKLPLANYDTATPSSGQYDIGAPLRVASAQANAASAKGAVVAALGQISGTAEAWYNAEAESEAHSAYADYRDKMSATQIALQRSPSIPVDRIPEGVQFEKFEKDGVTERTVVPSWEVAPAIYDQVAKQEASLAMRRTANRKTAEWMGTKIKETNTTIGGHIATQYYEGKKAALLGKTEDSIQKLVNAGEKDGAIAAIASAVKNGVFTPVEGVKRTQKAKNDAANLQVSQVIMETNAPAALFNLSDTILYHKGELTDEQAVSLSRRAQAKAERILTNTDKAEKKAKDLSSSQALTALVVEVRLNKRLPSKAEMMERIKTMTPEDARSALTLYDRKDGGEGGSSNAAALKALDKKLAGLLNPSDVPLDQRVREFQGEADRLMGTDQLVAKDWATRIAHAKNIVDRVTIDDPNYKQANETIYNHIAKNPKTSLFNTEGSSLRYAVAGEMEQAHFQAKMKDPTLNSEEWVSRNLPQYEKRAISELDNKLREKGFQGYITREGPGGGLNVDTTRAKIEQAYHKKLITAERYAEAINILAERPNNTFLNDAAKASKK